MLPSSRIIVLASTSPYRRELLARLRVEFTVASPGVEETIRDGEAPIVRAERLAIEKAEALAGQFPAGLIIGSDQVATLGDVILDKPGDHRRATEQLRLMSGREVAFYTAVALHDVARAATSVRVVPYWTAFRELSAREIEAYLRADQPYDCAAAAKAESLGIALLEHMRGDDPTALIGLPLIATSQLLRQHGIAIP